METRTTIIVTLRVEGFHCWPDAREKFPTMGFLADRHRHIFHIKAEKIVTHDDRDVEIIDFKRKIENHIKHTWGRPAEFKGMSCEALARLLHTKFDLVSCEVLEDGENGAKVTNI